MTDQPTPPKVLPPHWFIVALIGILATAWLLPGTTLPAALRWSGAVLIVAGVAIAAAGSRLFARAGTNIIPLTRSTTLVTHGVFGLSRNPMYTGMVATLAGTALLTQTLWGWLFVIGFFVLIRQAFVLREEPLLVQTFGASYEAYRSKVRRWL